MRLVLRIPRNQKKERDLDAYSAKKGNAWHFGYKANIGVNKENGLVHTMIVTSSHVHDVCVDADQLTGEEQQVYGEGGYLGAEKRPKALKKNKFLNMLFVLAEITQADRPSLSA